MRTILISGANRGLGLEFVRQYLGDGERVIAGVRDPDQAEALKALDGGAGRLTIHPLNVADAASIAAFRAAVGDAPIDLLIANAGIMGPDRQHRLEDLDFDGWLETFAVNSLGPVRLAQAFADAVAAGRDRKMIAVSSLMGSIADSSGGYLAYRSSKGALNNAWHNIALALRERGVTCIAVHPGWVQTDMGGPGATLTPEVSIAALRRHIDAWTLADTGKFLSWDGKELPW